MICFVPRILSLDALGGVHTLPVLVARLSVSLLLIDDGQL